MSTTTKKTQIPTSLLGLESYNNNNNIILTKNDAQQSTKKKIFFRKTQIPTSLLGLESYNNNNNIILTKNDALLFSYDKIIQQGGGSRLYKYKNYWYKKTYKRNGKEYIFAKNENKYINITKLKQKGGVDEASNGIKILDINAVELKELEATELPNDILITINNILEIPAKIQANKQFDSIDVKPIKDLYKYYICVFNSLFNENNEKHNIDLTFLKSLTQTDTTIIFDIKLSVDEYKRTQYKFNISDGALIEPQLEQQSALQSILDANKADPYLIKFIKYIKNKETKCQLFNVYIENATGIQSFDFMQKFTNLKFHDLQAKYCYIKCYKCINNLLEFGEKYLKSINTHPVFHALLSTAFCNLYNDANKIEYYYSTFSKVTYTNKKEIDDLALQLTPNRIKYLLSMFTTATTGTLAYFNKIKDASFIKNNNRYPPSKKGIASDHKTLFENIIKPSESTPPYDTENRFSIYYLCDFLEQSMDDIHKYIYDQYSIHEYKQIQQIIDKVQSYWNYENKDKPFTITDKFKKDVKACTDKNYLKEDFDDEFDDDDEEVYNEYINFIKFKKLDDIEIDNDILLPPLCPEKIF
jgi:hypothetical protein